MKRAITFVLLMLFLIGSASSQSLSELQSQRKKTEASIALTNKMLAKNSKNKNQELSNLKLLSRKISYRKKLISDIENETTELGNVIEQKSQIIDSYTSDLEEMKSNYAELIQYIWTRRSSHEQVMYVLAGKDIAQIYRRFRYLNEFSNYQKTEAQAIQELTQRLVEEKEELQIQRDQKAKLSITYAQETKNLQGEQGSKSKQIESLKKKEKELKKQLTAQQKKRDELKAYVAKLIAAEAKKATKNSSGKMVMTPEQKLTSSQFAGNKGKLPWPVANGIIDERYGTHTHEAFNRVKVENDGVDIQTDEGGNARSVFDGEVTSVNALPGYNKGIIVRHGEYLTFYANLSEVYVKKGDIVSTKQKLGKVFVDSNKKSIIHFEVWKGMAKQNPQTWLSK